MGFFANFSEWLNRILLGYIGAKTQLIATALEPAIITLGVLYVMIWGYLQLSGAIEEPFVTGVKRILTLALILGCALRSWMYTDVIVDTFFAAPGELAGRIIGSYDSVTIVDQIINSGYEVAQNLLAKAHWYDWNLSYIIAADAVYVVVGITAIYTIFLLSLAKIALSLLLALGPLFIALLFFETTRRLFSSWIAQLVNYAFIAILTVMSAALMLTLVKTAADDAMLSGDGVEIAQAVRVCMAAGLAFLVMRQVMPIAASLANGVALSSFNAVSGLMRWGFVGSAQSIKQKTGQFSRGLLDDGTTRWDSLSRKAGFYTKRGAKWLVSRNSITNP